MDELTEDFLLAKEGDTAAFGRVEQTLREPLTRYVWRLIGSESMIDDILQDAFVALYMNIESVDPVETGLIGLGGNTGDVQYAPRVYIQGNQNMTPKQMDQALGMAGKRVPEPHDTVGE